MTEQKQQHVPSAIDKTELTYWLEEAGKLNSSDYTKDGWDIFRQIVTEATGVKDDATATEHEVSEAVIALIDGMIALEKEKVYTVTVDGKKVAEGVYNQIVTITADASQVGQKFAGWQLKDKIVSYDEVYTFAISGNMAFVGLIPQAISMITKIVAGLAVLFSIDARFTAAVLGIGLLVCIFSRIYSRHFKYLHKEVQRTNGVVRSYMQECIENLIVIKSFANEHAVCGKLNQFQKDNYRIRIKRNAISNLANTLVYVLFTAGYYAALVWGAFQISFGVMTFGTLTAFLQIIQQIRAPFRNVSGLIPQYYSMQASAERLMEIEDMEEESQKIRIEDVSEFQKDFRAIVAEHVTFAYQNGDIILDDVSLRVNKGDLIAIVGESGIGKSTMMKLMLHLMPCESGKLYFETVNGKIEIDAGTRNVFSYVPQGNMIMSGTIRENITFCNHDIGEEEIRKAAEIACIWDYIETLPQGLETVLTERGEGLSEGQVQRIAIARAILNDAPILLLDECTSSLDKDTEWKVLQNLKKMNTKTIICISHTAAGVACCDRVVEIENKKFKEVSNDD